MSTGIRARADIVIRQFGGSSAYALAGAVAQNGANLVATVLLTRWLGAGLFGGYVLVQSTVGLLAVLAGTSLGVTATRFVSANRASDPAYCHAASKYITRISLILSSVLAIALVAGADPLSLSLTGSKALAPALAVSALLLVFQTLNTVQNGVLAGLHAFRANMVVQMVRGTILFPLLLLTTPWLGLPGSIAATAGSYAVASAAGYHSVGSEFRRLGFGWNVRASFPGRNVLWSFSFPTLLGAVIPVLAAWIASARLATQPSGLEQVALLGAATHWRMVVILLPGILSQPLLAHLSSAVSSQDLASFRLFAYFGMGANTLSALLIALALVLAGPVISGFYGAGFHTMAPVLTSLCVASVFQAASAALGQILASMNRMWVGLWLNLLWVVLFLGVFFLATPAASASDVAFAMVVAYVLHTVNTMIVAAIFVRGFGSDREPA